MNRPLAEFTWQELIEEMQVRIHEHGVVYRKGEPAEDNQLKINFEKVAEGRKA